VGAFALIVSVPVLGVMEVAAVVPETTRFAMYAFTGPGAGSRCGPCAGGNASTSQSSRCIGQAPWPMIWASSSAAVPQVHARRNTLDRTIQVSIPMTSILRPIPELASRPPG
jgi:hypothetical protein